MVLYGRLSFGFIWMGVLLVLIVWVMVFVLEGLLYGWLLLDLYFGCLLFDLMDDFVILLFRGFLWFGFLNMFNNVE